MPFLVFVLCAGLSWERRNKNERVRTCVGTSTRVGSVREWFVELTVNDRAVKARVSVRLGGPEPSHSVASFWSRWSAAVSCTPFMCHLRHAGLYNMYLRCPCSRDEIQFVPARQI